MIALHRISMLLDQRLANTASSASPQRQGRAAAKVGESAYARVWPSVRSAEWGLSICVGAGRHHDRGCVRAAVQGTSLVSCAYSRTSTARLSYLCKCRI